MKRKSKIKSKFRLLKPMLALFLFYFFFIGFFYLSLNKFIPKKCASDEFMDNEVGQCLKYSIKYPLIQRGNPAVEHCIDNEGVVKVETAENGEKQGICLFLEGNSCEIWTFLNGKCDK